jgi:hypothetical protein
VGKADLHAHSCHDAWGDGNQDVETLFRYVDEHTDLDLFAITDHDSTDAARRGVQLHRSGNYRFGFIPGVEVTNQTGHLLCYFLDGNVQDIPSLRPFWWTVRYARARGAICVAAHPIYPPWLMATIRRGLDRGLFLDGLEIVNSGVSEPAQIRLNGVSARLGHRVGLTGGSDAHEQTAIGSSYTWFPGSSCGDFVQALRDRATRPEFVRRPEMSSAARSFTTRRSMTRPGWVRNLWREIAKPERG